MGAALVLTFLTNQTVEQQREKTGRVGVNGGGGADPGKIELALGEGVEERRTKGGGRLQPTAKLGGLEVILERPWLGLFIG